MYSSVIFRSVVIFIALLMLASCSQKGSKAATSKAKRVKTESTSTQAESKTTSPFKPTTKSAATENDGYDVWMNQVNSR